MALWRVRATVVDKPGFLAVLAASLALRSVNILSVGVHITEAGAVDDFLVDAPDEVTSEQLLAAVARGRGEQAWVAPAEAHLLVDASTRAFDLATLVVRDPATVPVALAELLDATATWHPGAVPPAPSEPLPALPGGVAQSEPAGNRMQVPAPGGGTWLVARPAPDFTPAEYARAQALLVLAAASRERAAGAPAPRRSGPRQGAREPNRLPLTMLLPDGREVTLRNATPDDLPAVQELHRRCSPTTRYRRYLSGTHGPSEAQLVRLLAPTSGQALVAETGGEGASEVVALANLVGEGVQAELALLVEDGWQRHGIGTALLREATRRAVALGFDALVVHSHAQNVAMQRTLRRFARISGIANTRTEADAGVLTVTLPLSPRSTRVPSGRARR